MSLGKKKPYKRDAQDKYFPRRGAKEKVSENV